MSKKVFACEPHRILAKKIEPVVWEDVRRLLTDSSYASLIFEEAKAKSQDFSKAHEIERVKAKIASLTGQIEATTERVSELPKGISAQVFFDEILKLQKAKEEFESSLLALQAQDQNHDVALSTEEFQKFTDDLRRLAVKTTDPEVQASICRKLIEKVEVSTTGITIHYHVGDHHYQNVLGTTMRESIQGSKEEKGQSSSRKGPAGNPPAGPFFISKPLFKYKLPREDRENRQAVVGSNSLTNGRG